MKIRYMNDETPKTSTNVQETTAPIQTVNSITLPPSPELKEITSSSAQEDEPPEHTEEKEIAEVKKKYILTPKFNKWFEYFTQKGHTVHIKGEDKETYMNQTLSTIKAYNLDPVREYHLGSTIGHKNMRKAENLASTIAAEKGYTIDKFVDVAYLNMMKKESPEWWDRFGDMVGFRSMKPQVVVQNNTQNNTLINVPDGEKKSFNDQFREFVKAR